MQVPASRIDPDEAALSAPVQDALDELRDAFLSPLEPTVGRRHLAAMLAAAADPARC